MRLYNKQKGVKLMVSPLFLLVSPLLGNHAVPLKQKITL